MKTNFINFLLFISTVFISLHASEIEKNYICHDIWPNAEPPYHFKPNKCGPDSPLADFIPNSFGSVDLGEACNMHDRCWMELSDINQYGRCELSFTRELILACSSADLCIKTHYGRYCTSNPVEIAACESMVVPAYSAAVVGGVFFQRLKKTRDEQKAFERCVEKHGYFKREPKDKNSSN